MLGVQEIPSPILREPNPRKVAVNSNQRSHTVRSAWCRLRGAYSVQNEREEVQEILSSSLRLLASQEPCIIIEVLKSLKLSEFLASLKRFIQDGDDLRSYIRIMAPPLRQHRSG